MIAPRRGRVRLEVAGDALHPLPLPLVLAVASCLPADDKLRLALVSPAFRAVANETRLYQDVRLGVGSGVGRASDALLRAISAKAKTDMRKLDVSGCLGGRTPSLSVGAVAAVCFANAGLERLDVRCEDPLDYWLCLDHDDVVRLLAALPSLTRLDADVECGAGNQAHTVLSNPAVRVRRLTVCDFDDAASLTALLADLAGQPEVTQLELDHAPLNTAPALDSVVTFALTRRLAALRLYDCSLDAASVPALTRLLAEGALVSFEVKNGDVLPLSPAFVAAVHASRLQRLELCDVRLFVNMDAGLALLAAVTGHATLRHFSISDNAVEPEDRAAVGAAVGRLVAAATSALTSLDVWSCSLGAEGLLPLLAAATARPLQRVSLHGNVVAAERCSAVGAALGRMVAAAASTLTSLDVSHCSLGAKGLLPLLAAATGHPALQHLVAWSNAVAEARRAVVGSALGRLVAANAPLVSLDVSHCSLGDDGLRPLVIALPANTRLRSLSIAGNQLTTIAQAWVLASTQANTSLRKLSARSVTQRETVLAQAQDLVAARAQAGAGA